MDTLPVIWVVEDDRSFRECLRDLLEGSGYRVRVASGALEAMALVEAERPNLIVLDLMMPGINGQRLSHVLKQNPRLNSVPILALSGAPPEAVLAADVDWFLSKPVEARLLLLTVGHLARAAA